MVPVLALAGALAVVMEAQVFLFISIVLLLYYIILWIY